jgi:hypothetical protein
VGKILLFYAFYAFLKILPFCFYRKSAFLPSFTHHAREKKRLSKSRFSEDFLPDTGLYTSAFYAFLVPFYPPFFTRAGKNRNARLYSRGVSAACKTVPFLL